MSRVRPKVIKPADARYLDTGEIAFATGDMGAAIRAFEAAHRLSPHRHQPLVGLARAAAALDMPERAATFFGAALERKPADIEAVCGLARALTLLMRHGEAIERLKQTLALSPEVASLWLQLGTIVRETGDETNAGIFYREALRLNPRSVEALGNLADLAFDDGDSDGAFALYDRALALSPEHAQLRLNRAVALLALGRTEEGWREYEWRRKLKGRMRMPSLPRWQGDAAQGKQLLVLGEQGIGDEIAYAAFIPDLAIRADVTLLCAPRLQPLFARSFANVNVIGEMTEPPSGHQLAVDLASLPHLIGPEPSLSPVCRGYLRADEKSRLAWRDWLARSPHSRKIGLSWRSGKRGGLRDINYAALALWGAFARQIDADLICLQYGVEDDEVATLSRHAGVAIHVPPGLDQKNDLDGTAALIVNLDAVVSAPTSVAWLAASLGVTTLKIMRNPSWIASGKAYEPFAPSCRNIVPARLGDFASAFEEAVAILNCR